MVHHLVVESGGVQLNAVIDCGGRGEGECEGEGEGEGGARKETYALVVCVVCRKSPP